MQLVYKLTRNAADDLSRISFDLAQNNLAARVSQIEIDFQEVEHTDSLLLGRLLKLHLSLRSVGIEMKLSNINNRTETVLRSSSLDRVLRMPASPPIA